MILNLDRGSPVPVYRQILDGVVRLVDGGTLAAGDRLPPTRSLARAVGVHRSTVLRAYEELWALGYLESRQGSYSTVRAHRPRCQPAESEKPPGLIDWERIASSNARAAQGDTEQRESERPRAQPGVVDFSRLGADRELTPHQDLGRCLKAALAEQGQELLDYGDAAGYLPLRGTIARRLRVHGVEVSNREVVITNGAQNAIDLVLRALTRPGDRIVVESPTYLSALPLFRLHGLDLRAVPVREDGMDLRLLERALDREKPVLVYTMPTFQNPTGITTSQAHRERLLALCESRSVPILEDGFEEDLKYFGKAALPIKSMDQRGIVIYVGTFSKVVFPGLRIGWVAAPPGLSRLLGALQRTCCLAGNTLTQAAVHRFCEAGLYEAHVRRVHRAYRRRMSALLSGLAERMPSRGVEWTKPQGGYTLWLRVTDPRLRGAEEPLHARLLAAGVKLSPGSPFFSQAPAEPHFRICVTSLSEAEISEGCRRLGRVLRRALEA